MALEDNRRKLAYGTLLTFLIPVLFSLGVSGVYISNRALVSERDGTKYGAPGKLHNFVPAGPFNFVEQNAIVQPWLHLFRATGHGDPSDGFEDNSTSMQNLWFFAGMIVLPLCLLVFVIWGIIMRWWRRDYLRKLDASGMSWLAWGPALPGIAITLILSVVSIIGAIVGAIVLVVGLAAVKEAASQEMDSAMGISPGQRRAINEIKSEIRKTKP